MNAEEREDMKTIYDAAKQCQHEPHIPKDPIIAEWINKFVKLYEHSEEQAVRIAELEDNNYYQEESLRIIFLASTGENMPSGQTGGVAGKSIERMQRDKTRIIELEDKLRWRDCKTEPPIETGAYIVKQAEDGQPWLDIFRVDIGWENAWNGGPVPHSWRPIE